MFSLLDGFKDEYHHGPNKFRDVSSPNKFRDVSGPNKFRDVSGPNKLNISGSNKFQYISSILIYIRIDRYQIFMLPSYRIL